MYEIQKLCALLMILKVRIALSFFDPITLGIGAGIGLGAFKFDFIKDQTYCRYTECCNERYIIGDLQGLKNNLNANLFGQHIVKAQLIPALHAHFNGGSKPRKPLVISFHGTPGTGKNFVADKIAEALYKNGLRSKFVHKYLGRADFPLEAKTHEYQERISREVQEAIALCPQSLFIFDEVDKMPAGVFESLTSLVDYNTFVRGKDFSQAIFIFLSNTAGVHISDRLAELLKDGSLREDTKLSNFEKILEKAAYNLEGGMNKASLIDSHVIDHFIPFLPLEKSHVYKCVEAEFNTWTAYPEKDNIEYVMNNHVTYDRKYGIFATSGCKTLEKKIAVFQNKKV